MKVLLTHSEGRLEGLAPALASAGFDVTHVPLIRTVLLPAADVRPAASDLLEADWLLFTSRTAVSVWVKLGLPLSGIVPKVGVVGKKTREEVTRRGGQVSLSAQPANAEGLLTIFLAQVTPPSSVGLPCSEDALPTLTDGLNEAGFSVKRVPLYRSVPQPLEQVKADVVVLASPSAVAALPKKLDPAIRFVALGPSTHKALHERGLCAQESQAPDAESVVQAVGRAVAQVVELDTMIQERTLSLPNRPRRLRTTPALRGLLAETQLSPDDFVMPYFVVSGTGVTQPIASMPGVSRLSTDLLLRELERGLTLGVKAAMLFGVIDTALKDPSGKHAHDPSGPVAQALKAARRAFGNDIVLMTDVCLCGYTDHGHCGVLCHTPRGTIIDNDPSLATLAEMALIHAEAGADLVSPSDMMDGRVGYLRAALDGEGFTNTGILAYTVKYASAFYGPFRDAAGSSPKGTVDDGAQLPKDRKTYQMDFRNAREALTEVSLDECEGADLLMVKPALAYLDILQGMRQQSAKPLVAYQVSGEYAMFKAAALAGALEESAAVFESLTAIKRAGADLILSYYALEATEKGWLE